VNGYAIQSLAYSLPFDACSAADAINVPVLIVHSEEALTPDLAHAFYSALKSPKRALARVAGPDRFLRRPETRRPRSRCRCRIPAVWRAPGE
jgi:hypothetical protein